MRRVIKIKQMCVEDMALMLMCPAEYDTDFNKKEQVQRLVLELL